VQIRPVISVIWSGDGGRPLDQLEPGLELLLIENVGKSGLPTALIWASRRAAGVALRPTEGENKPLKFPGLFQIRRNVVVINKVDIARSGWASDHAAAHANLAGWARKARDLSKSRPACGVGLTP